MSTQLHTYVESRLHRWSFWVSASSSGPRRVISWWGPMILDRNVAQRGRRPPAHVDPTEAEETELAVRALSGELRDAIVEHWLKGGTMEQKALKLRCTRVTMYARIERANAKLLGYMNDIAAHVPLPVPEPMRNKLTRLYKISTFPATVA